MSRYIDADKLQEDFKELHGGKRSLLIDTAPTADVRENVRGEWIKLDMHAHLADHKCSACGQECYVPTCMGDPMYVFCPNCGADMRGDKQWLK